MARETRGRRAGWVPESGRTDLGIPESISARKNLPARKRCPARARLSALWQWLQWGLGFRRLLLLLTVLRESYVEGTAFSGGCLHMY